MPVLRAFFALRPLGRRVPGGGDAGSLLPGVLPPELGAFVMGHRQRSLINILSAPQPPHSIAILAQVRRLSQGIFGGLGGVVALPLARGQQISRFVWSGLCVLIRVTTSLLVCSSLCRHCWRTPNSMTSAILRRMLWSSLMATISLLVSSSLCRHS